MGTNIALHEFITVIRNTQAEHSVWWRSQSYEQRQRWKEFGDVEKALYNQIDR